MTSVTTTTSQGKRVSLRLRLQRARLYFDFLKKGGRFYWDWSLGNWVASKFIPETREPVRVSVVVRSAKEFRRFCHFGEGNANKIAQWLCNIGPNGVLWDVGSANGLEGCTALQAKAKHVVFLEPFTPSVETILKSLYVIQQNAGSKVGADMVQAACGEQPGFGLLINHSLPVPGETNNSMGDSLEEYCYGGRADSPISSTQWVKFTTLDELLQLGLPKPTHLKIDVDGLERQVLAGGALPLALPELKSAIIEINEGNDAFVQETMARNGFRQIDYYKHNDLVGDAFFEKQ